MTGNTKGQKATEQISSSDNTTMTAILVQLAQLTEVITAMRIDNHAINTRLKALEVRSRPSSPTS